MIKFSVLMSVYRNEKPEYLRESLESILNQTLLPSEILVVKDGVLSKELEAVLNEYKSKSDLFRFLSFDKNRGLGLALRDGLLECDFEYVARMDTDDVADLRRFEIQIGFLEKNPQVMLLGSNTQEFDVDIKNPYAVSSMPLTNDEIVAFAKTRNPFRHPTVIFNKNAIINSGNYSNFMWFEDYDLFVRVIQKGYIVANLPYHLVKVRADRNQFARRGGYEYAKKDIEFQLMLYEYGFISVFKLIINIILRSTVRVLPNNIRTFLYVHFLRRKVK